MATNNVLVEETKKETIYYVPAYLRLKVKNFTSMDLASLDAEMNSTLIFTVFCGELEKEIVDYLEQNIVFLFNRNDALELKEGLEVKLKSNKKERTFTYTIRKVFNTRISSNVFWSPFEIANLVLTITIQSVTFKRPSSTCTIKFNMMDHESNDLKLSYSESTNFGNYDLAEARLEAQYTNDAVSSIMKVATDKKYKKKKKSKENDKKPEKAKDAQQAKQAMSPGQLLPIGEDAMEDTFGDKEGSSIIKVKCFSKKNIDTLPKLNSIKKVEASGPPKKTKHYQYAHFVIPLYKYPAVTMITIFVPLWLLGILNLGIFFQAFVLADRIASIAGVMIAFVALIPTIREQIPPSPTITLVEILVYMETLTCFLCLVQSLSIRENVNFVEIWYTDAYFITSAIITFLTAIIMTVMFLLHKFSWEVGYNRDSPPDNVKFLFEEWNNEACDEHFANFPAITIHSSVRDVADKATRNFNKI